MKHKMAHELCIFCAFILFSAGAARAATAPAANVIVNPGSATNLSQTTGLSPTAAQSIIDEATGNQIEPEINIPAVGAIISGSGVVIKGVATPNAAIDILIQDATGAGGPIIGKTVSDRYGVWSYTLAPTLNNGSYSVQVTAQVGNITPIKSDPVLFSVSGSSTGGSIGSSVGEILNSSNNSALIIILAIIISLTFIITVIVLAMAPSLRGQRNGYLNKMKSWETPELLSLNNDQWENFVDKMETMRKYFAAEEKNHGRNSSSRLHPKPS